MSRYLNIVTNSWWLVACLALTGCVRQQLIIRSTPPGAQITSGGYLMGTTPLVHEFLWYEPYRIRAEHNGVALQDNGVLKAPFWMWFPLDGVMAVLPLPLKDRHYITFDFNNPTPEHVSAAAEPQEPTTTHSSLLDDLRRIHQQPK